MENQNRRIFFFFSFHPRILVLWKTGTGGFSFCGKPESENFFFFFNPRILVLWQTRIGEFFFFFFFFIREFSFFRNGEFSICGKRELENSRLVENQNRRTFFFFLSENSCFVETENSRFVENGKWRILVLWKTRIGEFFFFFFFFLIREFPFSGKPESENFFFFFFFFREFSFC